MNLVEWSSIPQETQRELAVEWHKSTAYTLAYMKLAEEAAADLKDQLRRIPEVTNVRPGAEEFMSVEDVPVRIPFLNLNVCTLLPEGSKLANIPLRHSGFNVELLNLGDKKDAYLRTWKRLFKELKGWNEKEALVWAGRYADDLAGGNLFTAIYSQGPVKLALSALVDKHVREREAAAGRHYTELDHKILAIFREAVRKAGASNYDDPDVADKLDWEAVKKSIDNLLNEK
jgi:hypothetical protein